MQTQLCEPIGDTRRPMIYLIIAGVTNVVLNLIFVIVLHMDVAGVALATIISQIISAILIVRALMTLDGPCRLDIKALKINKRIMGKIMKIGVPSGIGGTVISFSNVTIQSTINSFGGIAMAGNAATANIESFLWVALNAFGQGAMSFTGQNYAAGKMDRIKKVALICSALATGVGILMSVIAIVFSHSLLSFYSSSEEVIKYGLIRVMYNFPLYFILGYTEVFGGMLKGMGRSLATTIMNLAAMCLFRIMWVFLIFPQDPRLENLYISYPVSWALVSVVHIIYFIYVYRKHKKTMVISPRI
ncbi:MAG: MATE family efflux transporter [Clostridia bacterium]|nr:MATE family efflux transporter [Clostridia bacterium]